MSNHPLQLPSLRSSLLADGYAIIPNFFSIQCISAARAMLASLAVTRSENYFSDHSRIGSLIDITESSESGDLIASKKLLDLFSTLGFQTPVFQYGLGFVKKPGAPRSFWHQDGTVWGTDYAYQAAPVEIGALMYLQDTSIANGCLVVVPGSQSTAHPIHKATNGIPHATWRSGVMPDAMVYQPQGGEVPLEVQAGDLILLDMRVLHATRPNLTDEERSLITLVYFANWESLPESVHARYVPGVADSWSWMPQGMKTWPARELENVQSLLPLPYRGSMAPEPVIAHPDISRFQQNLSE